MWKNMVQPDRPQMTIWSKRFAFWIPKSTDTHSQYIILTVFFFYGNTGYANAPKNYVYTYIACLAVTVCQAYGPSGTQEPIITNLLQTKTPNEPLENGV